MSHLDTQTELDAVSPPPGAGSRSAVGGLLGLIRHRQWLPILVGLYAGIGFGLVVGPTLGVVNPTLAKTLGVWIAVPGELFLALLQLIVGPLVFASVVRGLNALV
ncbi:MAG: cation:dicarboxylase symporter family transporter, partial [bacterium]